MTEKKQFLKISNLVKFYLYGLQGIFMEVIYTSIYDSIALKSWRLTGVSSVWAFFIYATSHLAIEVMSRHLIKKKIPIAIRGVIYVIWTYFWEFSTGFLLKQFDACPWNYDFVYNFMGIITLEYAPMWYIACLFAELITIPCVNDIYYSKFVKVE
ncbi:transmembrane protein -like [Brachionus plicatilis]|uniref:Transmembrane protein-like n=1 Tax=Brachionus plicatilis TaxID=10195 RepID=A0A3M7SLN6_BRAPC|nr:transmembrane protein -like [Brachionus plicatilis]